MRLIVTGSREWPSPETVWALLDELLRCLAADHALTVVHGDAPRGVDRHVRRWCERHRDDSAVVHEPHPADWDRCRPQCTHPPRYRRDGTLFCQAAGAYRNQDMVDLGADLVLAFPFGVSSGTRHCMRAARAADIEVMDFGHLLAA